ncbi:hypothetical protein H0H92_011349 [Tricholoma furcatifolium]|nr:hypothetical protein H0H92_011349 [Tricholoma furcatifolium]
MFAGSISPTGQHPVYLRPETAQRHFFNFSRLLDFNNRRLPVSSAQIGRSFRNEIPPSSSEFTMTEIEHYVDPTDKSHQRFAEVSSQIVSLLDRKVQESGSHIRRYTPNVIESSFGRGRILYTLLEHSFLVLSLPPIVAPTKVFIVPLSSRDEFAPIVQEVCA